MTATPQRSRVSFCGCFSVFFAAQSRTLAAFTVAALSSVLASDSRTSADVVQYFDTVSGTASGEFAWDDFGTTGTSYAGPHAPDQFATGSGSAAISVTEGGLITSTNNLYSFFSVADWTHSLASAESSQAYTSIALQVAVSPTLTAADFQINGMNPDQFIDLGQRAAVGGFDYNFYWAEWQGLDAAATYDIIVSGTGEHESYAGAQLTYFNDSSVIDISAVPEPGSACILAPALLGVLTLRRRRNRRTS